MEQGWKIMELCSDFRAVNIVRERAAKNVAKSQSCIRAYMDRGKFGYLNHSAVVVMDPKRDLLWRSDPSLTTLINYKPILLPKLALGEDFHDVFKAAKIAFPELLSWNIRERPGNCGGLHVDEQYRPGLNHISRLPQYFSKHAAKQVFEPLAGNVTLSCATAHESTIVTKDTTHSPHNFFENPDIKGYQGALGDVGIYRGCGWPDANFLPAQHCEPSRSFLRTVAIASSNASYLHPQVREYMGWPRLPEDIDVELLAQGLERLDDGTNIESIACALNHNDLQDLKKVPASVIERFSYKNRQFLQSCLDV